MLIANPDKDWAEEYGVGGSELKQMFDSYDYDRAHSYVVSAVNFDNWVTCAGVSMPLVHLFGDVSASLEAFDKS